MHSMNSSEEDPVRNTKCSNLGMAEVMSNVAHGYNQLKNGHNLPYPRIHASFNKPYTYQMNNGLLPLIGKCKSLVLHVLESNCKPCPFSKIKEYMGPCCYPHEVEMKLDTAGKPYMECTSDKK